MRCILDRVAPIIDCYPNYGHILSIVGKHTKNYLPWIYNYFIQLYAPKNFEKGIRADFVAPEMFKSFPWLDTDHINRDIVNDKWQNIIDFIRDFINRD